jgi:hypothetical protein
MKYISTAQYNLCFALAALEPNKNQKEGFMKRLVLILLTVFSVMYLTACGSGSGDNTLGNGIVGGGSGGGSETKELFCFEFNKRSNGTYFLYISANHIYPAPEITFNGNKVNYWVNNGSMGIEIGNIPAGTCTYKINWNGNTFTRTINLPSIAENYSLNESGANYSVSGGSRDEKVIWNYQNQNGSWTEKVLPITQTFILPSGCYFEGCIVMHKDYKEVTAGYFATQESNNIAVYETISLWAAW